MINLCRVVILMCLACTYSVHAEVTFIHSDILGSPAAETNTKGEIISLSHYKAFGEEVEQKTNDVGYTGHKYDEELDLNYTQAR